MSGRLTSFTNLVVANKITRFFRTLKNPVTSVIVIFISVSFPSFSYKFGILILKAKVQRSLYVGSIQLHVDYFSKWHAVLLFNSAFFLRKKQCSLRFTRPAVSAFHFVQSPYDYLDSHNITRAIQVNVQLDGVVKNNFEWLTSLQASKKRELTV